MKIATAGLAVFAAVALAGCSAAQASTLPAAPTPTPVEDRPVTSMLADIALNGAREADALAIANGLCVQMANGLSVDDAGAEWIAVGWDSALVESVEDSVIAHPEFCETMAPTLKQVTVVG